MNSKEFETIFNQYYPVLCRYAFSLVKNKVTAEDIVQEQFINLWENRYRTSISSYSAYLFKAVKNKSINYLQSGHYKNIVLSDPLKESSKITNCTREAINHNELQQLIVEAIRKLPPRCSYIFYLKRFEEFSNAEIAKKLSISVKTVENQMTIAIRKITAFLRVHWS